MWPLVEVLPYEPVIATTVGCDPGQARRGLVDEAGAEPALQRPGDQAGQVDQQQGRPAAASTASGAASPSDHARPATTMTSRRAHTSGQGPEPAGPGQAGGPAPQRQADGPGRHPGRRHHTDQGPPDRDHHGGHRRHGGQGHVDRGGPPPPAGEPGRPSRPGSAPAGPPAASAGRRGYRPATQAATVTQATPWWQPQRAEPSGPGRG